MSNRTSTVIGPRIRSLVLFWVSTALFLATSGPRLCSLAAANQLPELEPVRRQQVGVGQRIFFGLSAIDQEGDDVRTELLNKPATAKFDERTLTVAWTPQATDDPCGRFTVRVTEFPVSQSPPMRGFTRTFAIPVRREPVPSPGLEPAPLADEALVSITNESRLRLVNERWSITKLLQRIAEIEFERQSPPNRRTGRSEFTRRMEQEQVGNLQGVIRDYLHIHVDLAGITVGGRLAVFHH